MFSLENVSKIYNDSGISFKALDNVNLRIDKNEIVSIIGKSGSGKTTLLNVMSTIANSSEGKVYYKDILLDELDEKEKARIRLSNFGFVFQKYELFQNLNIYDNIIIPVKLLGNNVDNNYIEEIIELLGLDEQRNKMPYELSGGQQQRVAIARAISTKPEVIFADEPTGNLDSQNSNMIIKLFFDLVHKYKSTLIYVTHDVNLAKKAVRMLTILDGKVIWKNEFNNSKEFFQR